jgi:hypothetical protein
MNPFAGDGEQGSRQRKTHKNYNYLAICVYQRMEAKGRRDEGNTGSTTACDRGACFLCVFNSLMMSLYKLHYNGGRYAYKDDSLSCTPLRYSC